MSDIEADHGIDDLLAGGKGGIRIAAKYEFHREGIGDGISVGFRK